MVKKVFTVFDSKAEAHLAPFYADTVGLALRMFSGAVQDQNHDFNKYAGDYTLLEIASFDDHTGKFTSHDIHKNLGTALEIKTQDQAERSS